MDDDRLLQLLKQEIPNSFATMPGYRVWTGIKAQQAYQAGYIAALRAVIRVLYQINEEGVP